MRELGWVGFALCAGLAFGCGGDDEAAQTSATTASSGAGGSGGGGGAGQGGDPCPAWSHAGEAAPCEATLGDWEVGPELNTARDHHATFIAETPAGTFLYAACGASAAGSPLSSVERSLLADDGTAGPFEKIEKAAASVIGPGFAQVGRGFVLAGGLISTGNSTAETWVGSIGDDGHITYVQGPALTADRYHLALVATKGYLFAIGGLQQTFEGGMVTQAISNIVERAAFDGQTLSAFEGAATLPSNRTHHAAFAYEGAIYIVGGGEGAAATTEILRASVGDAGELSAFEVMGQLPEGRATSAATVVLDHLYVFAGMSKLTGEEKSTVLRAPLDEKGGVGTFETLAPLPQERAHSHQTPFHSGVFYSVGGSIAHVPQKEVYVGRLH